MTHKNKLKLDARARQERFGGSYAAQLNQLKDGEPPRQLTVREYIERILVIAKDRRDAYSAWMDSIRERDGTDIVALRLNEFVPNKSDPTYPAYVASEDEDQRLYNAVRSLPEDVLQKLQAVMHMGCDEDDHERLLQHLRGDGHAVRAQMVTGKVPLDEYLENGLRFVDERGIDLQAALQSG